MKKLSEIIGAGAGGEQPAATLTLAFDDRRKSRQRVVLDSGEEAALVLPRGTVLRDGDRLRADGQLLTCEPARVLPLAQRYFLF